MKNYFLFTFFGALLLHTTSFAQCAEENALVKKYKQMADTAQSWDVATPAGLCKMYYTLACQAKQDTYEVDGQTVKRSEQEASEIEDQIKKTLDEYRKESNQLCGPLAEVSAVFAESIGDKEAHVVGYWVAKDKHYDKVFYPSFAFFNGGNFKMSTASSFHQKSSWEKISDYEYEITTSSYSVISKKYSSPSTGTFSIDPSSNTATYNFTRGNGKKGSSTWYYKGKVYSTYQKSEAEILSSVSVDIK